MRATAPATIVEAVLATRDWVGTAGLSEPSRNYRTRIQCLCSGGRQRETLFFVGADSRYREVKQRPREHRERDPCLPAGWRNHSHLFQTVLNTKRY